MSHLENETFELTDGDLDAVSGGGPIVDAMHYAQVVGALVAVYSRPAVEVGQGC
jgi:hypothetical protein